MELTRQSGSEATGSPEAARMVRPSSRETRDFLPPQMGDTIQGDSRKAAAESTEATGAVTASARRSGAITESPAP
jgi:hypothetical protein